MRGLSIRLCTHAAAPPRPPKPSLQYPSSQEVTWPRPPVPANQRLGVPRPPSHFITASANKVATVHSPPRASPPHSSLCLPTRVPASPDPGRISPPQRPPSPRCISVLLICVKALAAQSCRTLSDLKNCSPPGSSVHGILQPRILEWAAMPFSRGYFQPRDRTRVSCTVGRSLTV